MEDIMGCDYKHIRRIWDDFGMKNLGQYNDLHAQSDTLYLADPFKGFRKKFVKIYKLDPAHFLSAPGLT